MADIDITYLNGRDVDALEMTNDEILDAVEGGLLAAPHWVALGLRQRAAAGAERLRGHNGLGEAQDAVEGGANGSRTASSRLTRRRLVTTQGGRRAASSLDGRRVSGRSDGLLMPDACC